MRPALARRLLLMTLLLVSLTLFATTLGAMRLPLVNLLPSGDDMLRHIWLTIRLPRVLLALLVGAALALSGCVMQGLFRNPLADPGLLGISSGAALAVASWLVLPFSAAGLIALYMPMLAAFIGSLAVMVVIFILSRAEEGSLSRLLLVGIAINALCGALVGVLSWLSNDAQLRQLSLWGMGSLGQAEWPTLLVAATLIIPAALAVWWMASRLNLLQLGDEEAHYLGVNVQALQRWLFLDEPTSALDLYYQQHLLRLLKRLTAGGQLHVCVVLHDLNLAALWADRILLLHQGHLVAQGTPQEVIQQPVIHRWYGADVRLVQHPDNAVPQVYLAP